MLQEQINKETKTRKHFAINDWVTNHSLVGQVVNMEQKLSEGEVWVLWSGYSIPMNEPVVNLHPLDYEGKDLAGMSLPNGEGYCERLVYDEYSVQVEVHLEHKNSPQLWSLEKLARVQYGGKPKSDPSPDFEEKTFIPLNKIRRDGGTQPRANINHQTVLEYVEDMKKGSNEINQTCQPLSVIPFKR